MLKTAALLFGFAFLLIGVLGFVPGVTDGHMLLGVFHVNTAHNLVHITTGLFALVAAANGVLASRTFFRVFGVAYALVALLGVFAGNTPIFGIVANNVADVWLHAVVATVSLILGFVVKDEPIVRPAH